jgi:hypothetical protein
MEMFNVFIMSSVFLQESIRSFETLEKHHRYAHHPFCTDIKEEKTFMGVKLLVMLIEISLQIKSGSLLSYHGSIINIFNFYL